jgi:hypothetical protein
MRSLEGKLMDQILLTPKWLGRLGGFLDCAIAQTIKGIVITYSDM